ncbi:MAG: hypothetical protein EXS35_16795 [Pedosphaera sp.]|nr:hypothetical protein [Pedosphaera sp.]
MWPAILIAYALVGLAIITCTRARRFLRDKDVEARHIPLWKFLVFYALVFAAALLLWPFFLRSWFARPGTALEAAQATGGKLIVAGFRQIGACNGCPPTGKTSDEKIIEIYSRVVTAFRAAAKQRGEHIPANCLNTIVMGFLQMYEKMGQKFIEEHLRYEIDKYLASGLRPEYRRELPLF